MIEDDAIIEEVRRVRQEHAVRFNNDLAAIFEDLKRSEAARDRGRSPLLDPPETAPIPAGDSVQRVRLARP